MTAIKLLYVNSLADGTQRFQSQLYVGRSSADFIKDKDGVMKCYGHGKNGFDFYPYNKPFEIVENISAMTAQRL